MQYYELERSETWQTWPPEDSLLEFLQDGGRGHMITQLTITSTNRVVSVHTKDISADINRAHASLTQSMDNLRSELVSYDSSTKINNKFVLYANSDCSLRSALHGGPKNCTLSCFSTNCAMCANKTCFVKFECDTRSI